MFRDVIAGRQRSSDEVGFADAVRKPQKRCEVFVELKLVFAVRDAKVNDRGR